MRRALDVLFDLSLVVLFCFMAYHVDISFLVPAFCVAVVRGPQL